MSNEVDPKLLSLVMMEVGAVYARATAHRAVVLASLAYLAGWGLAQVAPMAGAVAIVLGPLVCACGLLLQSTLRIRALKKKVAALPLWERHALNLLLGQVNASMETSKP